MAQFVELTILEKMLEEDGEEVDRLLSSLMFSELRGLQDACCEIDSRIGAILAKQARERQRKEGE